ncbi:MAG: hypothetical protein M1816_001520 [Peltula sp. TS41687]|nr:MAG: hypothetical protein M1816_001520 [Peltula sp. TS41687]
MAIAPKRLKTTQDPESAVGAGDSSMAYLADFHGALQQLDQDLGQVIPRALEPLRGAVEPLRAVVDEGIRTIRFYSSQGHEMDRLKAENQRLKEEKDHTIAALTEANKKSVESRKELLRFDSSEGNEMDRLKAENQHLKEEQDHTIAALTEANKKSIESREELDKLRVIMWNSVQHESGLYDDDVITMFSNLKYSIFLVVKRHYSKRRQNRWWQLEPQDLSPENSELWTRAYIAEFLYDAFFGSNCRLFGVDDEKAEGVMADFEERLCQNGKVKEVDIFEWRIRTTSLAPMLGLPPRSSNPRITQAAASISRQLDDVCHIDTAGRPDLAGNSIKKICEGAYKIALLFRRSKAKYAWEQRADLSSLVAADVDPLRCTYPGFDIKSSKPIRVIFGAVKKFTTFGGHVFADPYVLCRSEGLFGPQ